MGKRQPASKAELEIARIVWDLGNATVRQVFEQVDPSRELDFKTVQTYLRRLEAKGYLNTQQDGRSKVYSPKVRPRQVIRETVDDFLQRLFDGATLPLVQHLISERDISANEIQELREMLDRWEQDHGPPQEK
ncbi:Penicillinase repressor [Symmachiella dynata]|jgi:BlaI family transcriptional regulator, penicillinase repressor|uniref:Penicillinase repressor n=1 Tax=Symmachiella dynata TaxID=2527995 RepID=A0A517ZR24_9PLAN|nr:BlaI/MecI/CopY family transcriptional regulator [Symmachiella dynata]QDT49251.1 Penicillinase repressor [Symmachiella dynata]QDU44917.1 Penicillinase repressor [Symmachiella dynata]